MTVRSQILMSGILLVCSTATIQATDRVLRVPTYDPAATRVSLWDGLRGGQIAAKLIPRGETAGALFIENLTDQPLTVEMPAAVVGVHVLPQDDFNFAQGPNSGITNNSGNNQPIGTGFPNGQGNVSGSPNNTGSNLNQGFFSIPSGRTVRLPYRSVCLDETKKRPQNRALYRLVPVESFSSDPRLPALLRMVGSGRIAGKPAQAAAWHIANSMSWKDLEQKVVKRLNRPDIRYFSRQDLSRAKEIVRSLPRPVSPRQSVAGLPSK